MMTDEQLLNIRFNLHEYSKEEFDAILSNPKDRERYIQLQKELERKAKSGFVVGFPA